MKINSKAIIVLLLFFYIDGLTFQIPLLSVILCSEMSELLNYRLHRLWRSLMKEVSVVVGLPTTPALLIWAAKDPELVVSCNVECYTLTTG